MFFNKLERNDPYKKFDLTKKSKSQNYGARSSDYDYSQMHTKTIDSLEASSAPENEIKTKSRIKSSASMRRKQRQEQKAKTHKEKHIQATFDNNHKPADIALQQFIDERHNVKKAYKKPKSNDELEQYLEESLGIKIDLDQLNSKNTSKPNTASQSYKKNIALNVAKNIVKHSSKSKDYADIIVKIAESKGHLYLANIPNFIEAATLGLLHNPLKTMAAIFINAKKLRLHIIITAILYYIAINEFILPFLGLGIF